MKLPELKNRFMGKYMINLIYCVVFLKLLKKN